MTKTVEVLDFLYKTWYNILRKIGDVLRPKTLKIE